MAMAEFGGFYGHATTRLLPLVGEGREVHLIAAGGDTVGFLDVDPVPSSPGVMGLSYFIAPAHRRRGLATQALRLLSRRHRHLEVSIDTRNLASLATARAAGFVVLGEDDGEIQLRLAAPEAT